MRPSKRGEGTTLSRAEATLTYPDGHVVTKSKDVTRAVTELLGIDKDQFTQIAMLAQGDFLRLLYARTEERSKIFREIFHTRAYQSLQDKLKGEANALRQQCEENSKSIEQYRNGILWEPEHMPEQEETLLTADLLQELDRTIDCESQKIQEISGAVLETEGIIEKNNQILGRIQTQEKLKAELEKAVQEAGYIEPELQPLHDKLINLQKQKEQMDTLRAQICIEKEKLQGYDAADALRHQQKQTEQKIVQNEHSLTEKEEKAKILQKQYEDSSSQIELLQSDGLELVKMEQLLQQEIRRHTEWQELLTQLQETARMQQKLEQKQSDYRKAYALQEEQRNIYERLQQQYLDGQAGVLAQTMQEGKPCPVCGSVHHPAPAIGDGEAPDREQVARAKQNWEESTLATQEASAVAGRFKGVLESAGQALMARLEAEKILCPGEDEAKDNGEVKSFLAKRADIEGQLQGKLHDSTETIDNLQKSISELQKKKQQAEKLQEKLVLLDRQIQEIQRCCKETEDAIVRLKIEREVSQQKLDETLKTLAYDNKDLAKARLEEQIHTLTEYEKLLEMTEKNCREKERAYQNALQKQETLRGQLVDGTETADVESLMEEQDRLLENKKALQEKHQGILHRYETNRKVRTDIEQRSKLLQSLEKKWNLVKELSDTYNGNLSGKDKVMLETYVQMQYFDRIIRRANTRFMVMSAGQYELERSRQAENMRSQSGLELDVIDHYNGTRRSVKTLSGGEAFLASLSLALGLSDEIQSISGGITLDTMFVDEGFGSLDETALDQAIYALQNLTEGNRLVGIISHVSELQGRIDKRIIVTKDAANTSRVKLVTDI